MTTIDFAVKLSYIWNLDEYADMRLYTSVRAFAKEHNCHMYESDYSIFSATEEDLLLLKIKHPGAITHIRES
jgi:hypothetical protein